MLNRLTVSALLKTVILVTSFCVVVGFSLNAWDSWGRLQAASRIAVIADASANIFKAMHNLRTDRSTTNRLLNSDAPMDPDIEKYLRNIRDTEMPAMGNALGLLGGLEFAQHQTLVPEFDRVFNATPVPRDEEANVNLPPSLLGPDRSRRHVVHVGGEVSVRPWHGVNSAQRNAVSVIGQILLTSLMALNKMGGLT